MRWLLKGKGLLEHVLGTAILKEDSLEEERRAYTTNDNKAIANIGLNVEPEQQIHIEDCATAYEA